MEKLHESKKLKKHQINFSFFDLTYDIDLLKCRGLWPIDKFNIRHVTCAVYPNTADSILTVQNE